MVRRYEALMLAVPELTKDETTTLEKGFDKVVRSAQGSVISFERWGKYRLAFPVRRNDYGIYFLARFEIEDGKNAVLDDLKTFFTIKVNNVVMRNVVSRLATDASLAYQRPKSLEEAATSRDVGTFLKENKMEGLLPSSGSDDGQKEASSTPASQPDQNDELDIAIEELDTDADEANDKE